MLLIKHGKIYAGRDIFLDFLINVGNEAKLIFQKVTFCPKCTSSTYIYTHLITDINYVFVKLLNGNSFAANRTVTFIIGVYNDLKTNDANKFSTTATER